MSRKEEGRPDLNRREKHGMEIIMACASEMHKTAPMLKERLTMKNPYGYRLFKMALGLLDKALGLIYETTPIRQLQQMRTICLSGAVTLNTSPALTPPGYTAVKASDMNVLCGAAVNEKCALCMEEGGKVSQCELRKTLMTVWPPKEIPKYRPCPYQGVKWYDKPGDIPEDEEATEG